MSSEERPVASAADLAAACKNADLRRITVRGSIANAPPVRLAPGQSLQGENDQAEIAFAAGSDGLQLSSDNQVRRIHLRANPDQRAIFNDTRVDRRTAEEKITSFGPSGIGFVNFGVVNELRVRASIETFGQGARGFSGSAREIEIDGGIVTNGEGIPPLELHGEIQSSRAAGGFAARGGGFDRI